MDDLFLIKQVVGGNRDAFKFLVLRYQRPIFRFLSGFGLSPSVAEEIAQEVFVRAYKNLASYDPQKGSAFLTWLFTIARNLTLNEISKQRPQVEVSVEIEDETPNAQAALETAQTEEQVRGAIQRLPVEFRSAVVLSYLQEHSIEEIARIENCSPGTVKSRVFRGKQLLKSILLKQAVAK